MDFQVSRLTLFLCFIGFSKCFHISMASASIYGREDGKNSEELLPNLRRTVRSPQLFSGKSILPDLTQFKPPPLPTLNDLNEFKQRMSSLANLTALLERAIAAEKTARTTLQGFVDTIKDQIVGVQQAVNPDPENYWAESRICGGILVSQTGRILYKPNDYYNNGERCTWTVRANHRSKIRVTLNNGGLEEGHDYVAATELIEKRASNRTEWSTKRLTVGQTVLFEGPLIFISFVSDGSIRRKGFQLEFEGMGSNINSKTIYHHFHFSNRMGHFDSGNLSESLEKSDIKIEEGSKLMATMIVNPVNWNMSTLNFSLPEGVLDLRPDECDKTNLAIMNEFATFSHGISQRCCGVTCTINNFDTSNGVILSIFESSDLTDGSHFQMDWFTDFSDKQVESVDSCGGKLTGTSGKISYKENRPYDDNERCVWIIQPEIINEGEIKIQLLKDGFEQHYDFVTLSFLPPDRNSDSLETKFLFKSGPPVQIPSPFVIVEFYSDAGTFGKSAGFELIWEIKHASNNHIGIELEYNSEESGSKLLSCSAQQKENGVEQITVINVLQTWNGSKLLNLQSNEPTSPEGISLFVGERGNFSKISHPSGECQSKDGIIVVKQKCSVASGEVHITWQIDEAPIVAESTDNPLYSKSENKCGEILFGDSGQIEYKVGIEYELNERCTWIIRPKRLSTITVQLMTDGFESCCDGLQVNKINIHEGLIDPESIAINRENRFQTLDATALLVTFISDHSVTGTGFALEFQTKGDPVANTDEADVKHWHVKLESRPTHDNPFGPVFIQPSDNLFSIDTFAFQHVQLAIANISVELKMENLQINECNEDSIALYHMPVLGIYEMLKQTPSKEVCSIERLAGGLNPVSALSLIPQAQTIQLQPKGILVAITKIKSSKPEKTLSIQFQ